MQCVTDSILPLLHILQSSQIKSQKRSGICPQAFQYYFNIVCISSMNILQIQSHTWNMPMQVIESIGSLDILFEALFQTPSYQPDIPFQTDISHRGIVYKDKISCSKEPPHDLNNGIIYNFFDSEGTDVRPTLLSIVVSKSIIFSNNSDILFAQLAQFSIPLNFNIQIALLSLILYFILNLDMRNQNPQLRGRRIPRQENRTFNATRAPKQFDHIQSVEPHDPNDTTFKKKIFKRRQQDRHKPSPAGGRDGNNKGPRKGPRNEKRGDDRDLDRELRDYWLNQKGGNKAENDGQDVARQKLNSEMDSYWKQRKEEAKPDAS